MALLSWLFQRRNSPPPTEPAKRHDPDRIAVLEHDLLGIVPEAGTPAARAVALAKPVDQDACPHDDVIDVTQMGQARAEGICGRCGTDMVENDEGDWERP